MLTEVVLVRYQLQCSGLTVTAPQPPGQPVLTVVTPAQTELTHSVWTEIFSHHKLFPLPPRPSAHLPVTAALAL